MKYNHEKFNRERQIIFREKDMGEHISITELLEVIRNIDNQKEAFIHIKRTAYGFGCGESATMVLATKSLETDEEWATRLREMDREAEASRKKKEAAEKKERAEFARLKAKYESGNARKKKQ